MTWGRLLQPRTQQLLPYKSTTVTPLWSNDLLFGPYMIFHSEHSLGAQFPPGKHWYLFFYSLSYIFASFFPVAMSSAH